MIRRGLAGLLGLLGFFLLINACLSNSTLVTRLLPAVQIAHGVQTAQADTKGVIVILRDQLETVPLVRGAHQARADALSASQNPYVFRLQAMRSRKVVKFKTINAFATNVSKAEADQLSSDPGVRAVVPDSVVRLKPSMRSQRMAASMASAANITSIPSTSDMSAVCDTLEPEALQLTNTAFLDLSKPQAQRVRDGNGQFVTGRGVKVAFIADGLDTTVAGFTRPDGTNVFVDYQDFSGDPAGTPSDGSEAFGDASSIAAQDTPNNSVLTFDISQFVNPTHALPSPCNIRIRGMAPGASLVGLKALSASGSAYTSAIVQAIEYAVVNDGVDVISESFFGNYFDMETDPIALANRIAVSAGTTVVVCSGDEGLGSLGSTDPSVIQAGASTQFRFYAQTGSGVQPLANGYGYLSNNISGFSSGGFGQLTPRILDVVAPGDQGWALCSTSQELYPGCYNFNNFAPSPIESFGGTSESAPLVAGEVALIIQAYRSTHRNANPSPALVKEIIKSTATDLGATAIEEGAGLINTLAAVQAALSVADGHGTPTRQGNALLITPQSALVVATPNTRETETFTITNTGSATQHLAPKLQMLGPAIAGATLNLTLDPVTDPTAISPTGEPYPYITQTFTVPSGAHHLDAAIAWQNPNFGNIVAYIGLVDPSGRQVAFSDPFYGGTGYGHVDVVAPVAGRWTAVITTLSLDSPDYSYAGPVQFTWSVERFVDFGTISPGKLDLVPGASTSVVANFTMPSKPGDTAAALRFNPSAGGGSEIPITLRTPVSLGANGGNFTGTLTGSNQGFGPTQTFEFNVPNGVNNMSLNLNVADSGYLLEGLLVDPQGMQLSVQGNVDANGNVQGALQQFRDHPQPGRWLFVLLQNYYSSGNQTSLPFTARIGFNTAQYSASQVPNNRNYRISASGGPVTIPISVTNNGALTEWYFADARLATLALSQLPTAVCSDTQTLPGFCGYTFLPPEVSGVTFVGQSSVPITMDAYNFVGYAAGYTNSPHLYARSIKNDTAVALLVAPEVPWGYWYIFPSLIGPYGPSGAPTEPVQTYASVLMKPFDPTITGDSGNVWQDLTFGTNTFNPLILAPGQSGTINLTITPDRSQVGHTVTGYIYLDTFNSTVFTGDEVARIPYTYTVSP
jgi:hypothetical protein